jgi:hypothetical protein
MSNARNRPSTKLRSPACRNGATTSRISPRRWSFPTSADGVPRAPVRRGDDARGAAGDEALLTSVCEFDLLAALGILTRGPVGDSNRLVDEYAVRIEARDPGRNVLPFGDLLRAADEVLVAHGVKASVRAVLAGSW